MGTLDFWLKRESVAVTRTFRAPQVFDPSYSLMGRAFRAWTDDHLQGEALYIVTLTGIALFLLMSHYLGWALLRPVLSASASWKVLFWTGQGAFVLLWIGIGLVGRRPAVTVECTSGTLEIEQGERTHTIRYEAVDSIASISARQYHRHYRRYAATRVFAGSLADEVLLLRTAQGPVVIALPESDEQESLRWEIKSATEPVPSTAVAQPSS